MATITGLTAARMLAIEAACIVDGDVVGDDLILTKHDTTTINAGNVRGPAGTDAAVIPVVSSLPGSPTDGDEVYFQNATMASAGVMWHLRYRAGATGSYKWEYIGGPPMVTGPTNPGQQTTTATYQNLSGPTVNTPLAGDYDVEVETTVNDPTTMLVLFRPTAGGSSGTGARMSAPGYNGATITREQRFAGLAAATVCRPQFYVASAQTAGYGWSDAYVRITPVRVG